MAEQGARVALGVGLVSVGQLRFTRTGPRKFSTFTYDPAWREDPRAFAIQPGLPLEGGPFHASAAGGDPRDAHPGPTGHRAACGSHRPCRCPPGLADQLRLADIFLCSPAQGSLEPGIESDSLYAQAAADRPYRENLSMLSDERVPHLFGAALEPMAGSRLTLGKVRGGLFLGCRAPRSPVPARA